MREIKFRAWDKEAEQMAFQKEDGNEYVWMIGTEDIFIQHIAEVNIPEQILMQYTGLKDKNGVEVYEGDIVRIIDDGETDIGWGWNEIVIFHNGAFMAGDDNLLVNVNFRCLVIGNMYEDPKLMEA